MDNLNELLGNLTEFLKTEVKTETIIGQQFQLGEFTCVPVMAVGLGLGSGGGEGKGNSKKTGEGEGVGAGGGAGIGMGPVGFLVVNGSNIQFISTRTSKGLNALFEKAPDILEKYFEKDKEPAHHN
ncbi:MAG TPA: GerW family sporulation protein [Mucilaginibacter sp.]|jgi:uncharacterized spore protein YtfJ